MPAPYDPGAIAEAALMITSETLNALEGRFPGISRRVVQSARTKKLAQPSPNLQVLEIFDAMLAQIPH